MRDTRLGPQLLGAGAIVAAAALGIVAWQWAGAGASDPSQPRAALIFIGDQCHLVPTTCQGPGPSTTFVIDDTAPLAPGPELTTHLLGDSDAAPLEAAVVAVPAPPPRPA